MPSGRPCILLPSSSGGVYTAVVLLALSPLLAQTAPTSTSAPAPDRLAAAHAVFAELLSTPHTLSNAQVQRVQALLGDLAAPSWQTRQEAVRQLELLPPAAAPLVAPAAASSDLEVALRAQAVHQSITARARAGDSRLYGAAQARRAAGETALVPDLIALLDHPASGVRYAADSLLRDLTGQSSAFNPFDEPPARQPARAAWAAWWKQAAPSFRFPNPDADPMAILAVDFASRTVTALRPDGAILWTRTARLPLMSAWPTGEGKLLLAYAGVPQGQSPLEEIAPDGRVLWSGGAGAKTLLRPQDVRRLPNGNTLVADGAARRVVELAPDGKVVWETGGLMDPRAAQRLPNGNTLIVDHAGQCLVEVDPAGKSVWGLRKLLYPFDATKLPNGNVLVTEHSAQRIIEVDRAGKPVWQRPCTSYPSGAVRFSDGATAIATMEEGLIVVDPSGKTLRRLLPPRSSLLRLRLVPESLLVKKP